MGAVFGSLAALFIGLAELFGRRIVAATSVLTGSFLLYLFGAIVPVSSVFVIDGSLIWIDVVWGALSGIGMALGLGFYFQGLSRSSATVVAPTVATLTAVIPYVYALLRGAEASGLAIVGAIVSFVGLAVLAGGTVEAADLRQGLTWGGLSGLGYGAGISLFVEVGDDSGAWPAAAQRVAALLLLIVAVAVMRAPVRPPKGTGMSALGAGIFGGSTAILLLLGLRADAPSAIVTSSMFPVASVLFGFLFFSDPVARRQALGIAVALSGIALVVGA